MAILKSLLDFTGSMGPVSAYKRRDLEKTILRGKGGGSKKKIYNSPSCKNIRDNFTEFSLCGKMGGCIRRSMFPMKAVSDYNYTPQLTAISKIIQTLDTESVKGERDVLLSKHKHLLTGFSLNRKTSFENIVKPYISCKINRAEANGTVSIPELMPGINFMNPKAYPFYRFIINLGCVQDKTYRAFQPKGVDDGENIAIYSDWRSSSIPAATEQLNIQLRFPDSINDKTTLILSVGIQFGTALTDAIIEPVKYAGAAKIIAVA